jgi:hypothetical protein
MGGFPYGYSLFPSEAQHEIVLAADLDEYGSDLIRESFDGLVKEE